MENKNSKEKGAKSANDNMWPMRINKYLALNKISTRRGADELIEKRQIFINGKIAKLGNKVSQTDKVDIKGGAKPKKYIYLAFNKPKGVITHSPKTGEKDIKMSVPMKDVFPLGRLDKDSHGLIILTNDGRITDKLLNPKYEHTKEYIVKTIEKLRPNFKEKIEAGVNIEGYQTAKCKVEILGEKSFKIILTEGKKHQIRRMISALFNNVDDLKRVKIMNIELGNLSSGQYREILGAELDEFLGGLGF